MANLVTGKITGHGPVKTAPYPNGEDIAFLEYDGIPKPIDLDIPFLHALPMVVVIDMDTLSKNWVKFSPKVLNQTAWVELPRFIPDAIPAPSIGKQYKVELTITGIISEITE